MLQQGSVAQSIAGRDKQRFFVVLKIEGDFAFIADGKRRKIDAPKRKRLKHLQKTNTVLEETSNLTDKQLRKLLSPLNNVDKREGF